MDRRAFLIVAVSVGACGRKEVAGGAVPRVAILVFGSKDVPTATSTSAAVLVRKRMTELGYVDGKTVVFEEHYADGNPERLHELARQIVDRKPDVIAAIPAAATAAARKATSVIPIVMTHAGDPVGSGLVASLARPGGNVTGTTSMAPDLGIKQIEVLRELLPGLAKLGVLVNPTNPGAPLAMANIRAAAQPLGIDIVAGEVTRAEDFGNVLALLRDARPDALFVVMEPMIGLNRERILEFARANRLPTSFDVGRETVRQGGLISYGPVLSSHYAIVADYVDKILKGAKPGELPVHQPTEFALVVNVKAARELGITIPQSLLARADEVVE
jgi:putative ABC transport system substrate-binding protein